MNIFFSKNVFSGMIVTSCMNENTADYDWKALSRVSKCACECVCVFTMEWHYSLPTRQEVSRHWLKGGSKQEVVSCELLALGFPCQQTSQQECEYESAIVRGPWGSNF